MYVFIQKATFVKNGTENFKVRYEIEEFQEIVKDISFKCLLFQLILKGWLMLTKNASCYGFL